ncbi:MAG: hypothetical protein KDA89_13075 [Planctomycetaceae bacterium]|nr:hypothetical protein [Planctomycetaceae bacterium]
MNKCTGVLLVVLLSGTVRADDTPFVRWDCSGTRWGSDKPVSGLFALDHMRLTEDDVPQFYDLTGRPNAGILKPDTSLVLTAGMIPTADGMNPAADGWYSHTSPTLQQAGGELPPGFSRPEIVRTARSVDADAELPESYSPSFVVPYSNLPDTDVGRATLYPRSPLIAQAADETVQELVPVPVDEIKIADQPDNGADDPDEPASVLPDVLTPIGHVGLRSTKLQAVAAEGALPENRAGEIAATWGIGYVPASFDAVCRPNRNMFPICYRPLYFEDPNLERCGIAAGCLTDVRSAAYFFGRMPVMPYLTTADPPCVCVRAKPDCPCCHSFGCDGYIPPLRDFEFEAGVAQYLATVGLIFLIP